jgi:hypothetical protein
LIILLGGSTATLPAAHIKKNTRRERHASVRSPKALWWEKRENVKDQRRQIQNGGKYGSLRRLDGWQQ